MAINHKMQFKCAYKHNFIIMKNRRKLKYYFAKVSYIILYNYINILLFIFIPLFILYR